MKLNKEKIKKNLVKIGLDAAAILVCGLASVLAGKIVPILKDLEVFLAVASGIWLYIPLRKLIDKVK